VVDDALALALLASIANGELTVQGALRRLAREPSPSGLCIDAEREARTGVPEVVFGEGKTVDQMVGAFQRLHANRTPALATRVPRSVAQAVMERVTQCTYEPTPRLLWRRDDEDPFMTRWEDEVAVITGGASDEPVAEEAARCAEWMGLNVSRHYDIGVAGLHRLINRLPALRRARVILAVAGMEGALPGVVAGLLASPVIAVPTSVGYGAHLGGLTTMLSMSNACSGGVAVMNVDNGFGAALFARRIIGGGS